VVGLEFPFSYKPEVVDLWYGTKYSVGVNNMAKTKIAKESTKGVGKGYGKRPLKSPKVGGPGTRKVPVRA